MENSRKKNGKAASCRTKNKLGVDNSWKRLATGKHAFITSKGEKFGEKTSKRTKGTRGEGEPAKRVGKEKKKKRGGRHPGKTKTP